MIDPHNIQLVQQIDDKTCVAACLAMVTGKAITQVIAEFNERGLQAPYYVSDYAAYLVRNNILPDSITTAQDSLLEWGKAYLVSVASKNVPGGMHTVLLCTAAPGSGVRDRVLDPQHYRPERRYWSDQDYADGKMSWSDIVRLTDCS